MGRKRKAAEASICESIASMDVDQPVVSIESSDGARFVLNRHEAACSNVLRVLLEQSPGSHADTIVLKHVDAHLLARIVDWCEKHPVQFDSLEADYFEASSKILRGDTKAANKSPYIQHEAVVGTNANHRPYLALNEWQREFFQAFREDQIFRLLHVANYLDIQTLFDAACQTIAKRWESKKVEEIRKQYRIHSDYSQEEELQMRLLSKRLGLDD